MKTILLPLLLVFTASDQASAIEFQYRYNFPTGEYVVGNFYGQRGTDHEELIADFSLGDFMRLYSITGELLSWTSPSLGTPTEIPISGSPLGLNFWFTWDSDYSGADVSFLLYGSNKTGEGRARWEDEELGILIDQPFHGGWQLSPSFGVPDSPATLSLLSLGLIGLAGAKRASSRRL